MRCEICNKSLTQLCFDGNGDPHYYCPVCIEEIEDALESYESDEDSYIELE